MQTSFFFLTPPPLRDVESFRKSYFFFLTCCVRVNSCSLTLMTAVHFLHQTDIGLALRKHEAIYGITPTLFSPSLSFSPSRVCLCAAQTRARRRTCHSPRPNSSLSPSLGQICVSPSAVALALRRGFHPSHPSAAFSPLRDCFAGDLTAVINDLGAPGEDKEGR